MKNLELVQNFRNQEFAIGIEEETSLGSGDLCLDGFGVSEYSTLDDDTLDELIRTSDLVAELAEAIGLDWPRKAESARFGSDTLDLDSEDEGALALEPSLVL